MSDEKYNPFAFPPVFETKEDVYNDWEFFSNPDLPPLVMPPLVRHAGRNLSWPTDPSTRSSSRRTSRASSRRSSRRTSRASSRRSSRRTSRGSSRRSNRRTSRASSRRTSRASSRRTSRGSSSLSEMSLD